ncbi:MAG: transcriptional regulator [Rhodothermaceae bacterium]|nr:transcriptional regulator [Rhodothermaceae bacterium]MYE63675.1 transcriptional regulator [Rhodothermaceae bacterium]MYJ19618.1 transcriptional regulator [Rhodothermaceae bacterium]
MPKPREVYDDPSSYIEFLTEDSDDRFESGHFERKKVNTGSTKDLQSHLKSLRKGIIKTISAFANSNVEGGLLVLGIATDGSISGINHLSDQQINSLTNFGSLLHNQAAEARLHECNDNSGNKKTICLIFVPCSKTGICETQESNPKAWIRSGSQSINATQEMRDQIRTNKGFGDFKDVQCCEFNPDDIDKDILKEFRLVFHPETTVRFDDVRLLLEAGAIIEQDGKYWFTHAGLLFFGANPQKILAASYIRLLRYEVLSSKSQQRDLPTFEKDFKGPLTKQIREARIFFRESAFFKRYQKRIAGGGFKEEPEFPPTVIDEAIVNSVAHRDYRTELPIECEAYQDAFIVKNPGRILQRNRDLPDKFSLSDTILDSKPRNAKLLEWLKIMRDSSGGPGYVRAISEGTKQMLKEMTDLNLPAPEYELKSNETLLKLGNNSVEREAAIRAASQIKSTEFTNLFPLSIRRGDSPVAHKVLNVHYGEFLRTLRDVLEGNDWYIDRFGFSRILAHRRGTKLDAPSDVEDILWFCPAYEFQIRQYLDHFYLCLDYKCQVHNVQRLDVVGKHFEQDKLINRLCVVKDVGWRRGKIVDFSSEFARIFFFDTESEQQVATDSVIPYCSLDMLKISLQKAGILFDLSQAIRKHSLASKRGSARDRIDKMENMVGYIADTLFPIQFGDILVDVTTEPLRLVERGKTTQNTFPVSRLPEPKVMFRESHSSPDVRTGITKYGAYDTAEHGIEIIPVCLRSMANNMKELINRLQFGKFRYRGAERTFTTRFSYPSIVGIDRVEDAEVEISRLLEEHPDWKGHTSLERIFLVHVPEQGYARDDHTSPYYKIKRLLLEKGIPCQMVDSPTLRDPDWKDLNLALNIVAKCGVRPWVLPDAIPDADFFVGLSYTQSRDRQRIMGFANVFNHYGKWEFYSGNTSYFDFEKRTFHLAQLVEKTLSKLKTQLSPTPQISFHYSAKLSGSDRDSIVEAARKVIPEGTFTFVWVNSHHNVRFYDNRPETDGSLRRGSYVEVAKNKIYLSTTGYNAFRQALGTPKPLEISMWVERPEGSPETKPDLRVLATQVLNLTKLNWASTDSFCGEPITLKYAGNIAYLTAAFLRQSEPFNLHPVLEKTPWFI